MVDTNLERIVIKTPMDLGGLILTFLRRIFSVPNGVINGLYWSNDKSKATISIEINDKQNQEKLSVRPSVFVSIGTISVESMAMNGGTMDLRFNAISMADGTPKNANPGRNTVLVQNFPVKISLYSSKTECHSLSYKLTKLLFAFRRALEKSSNIHTVQNFTVSPPQFIPQMDGDVYRSEINFSAMFFDYENVPDLTKMLKLLYAEIRVSSTGLPEDEVVNNEIWIDQKDMLFPGVDE